ncbi:MAG: DUF2442 domain-containing protein [Drouetiella hepatica Uher 2000/2452]|uniref:DUF2442 domain-containing protein n=1 Tax=Drouetiella hepatica Uher 2000/2452 TaxID=904376 RepID=A0A951QG95_9CYAN|nr:DUF2442 domain-containing protein [Drouetiella hepatica Uher 2000/2452]
MLNVDGRQKASGYGIHWLTLDEDLSINGLLKLAAIAFAKKPLLT